MKKYLKFCKIIEKPKTNVYEIRSIADSKLLGVVQWYGEWRQYAFEPIPYTSTITYESSVWSSGCLKEICVFLDKLMADRKKK